MARCKDCGVKLDWVRVKDKWLPFTQGVRHWEVCKAKGVLEIRRGEKVVGKQYTPSCGDCGVPPWEACGCSSLLGVTTIEGPDLMAEGQWPMKTDGQK